MKGGKRQSWLWIDLLATNKHPRFLFVWGRSFSSICYGCTSIFCYFQSKIFQNHLFMAGSLVTSKVKNPGIDFLTFLFCVGLCVCVVYMYCGGVHVLQHMHRGQRTAYRRQFIPSFSHAVPKGLRSSHSVTSAFTPWHHLTSPRGKLFENSVLLY